MSGTKAQPKKLPISRIAKLRIASGGHGDRSNGLCVMEAVAWVAGEPHTDHPECVCPVISAFLRSWNDGLPDDESRARLLKPLIPKVLGTRNKAKEERRAFMAMDWTVRTFTPTFLRLSKLDASKLDAEADALAALPEIVDLDTLEAAINPLAAAREKAAAAWAAARAAAWAAAWDAARAALKPTVTELQKSALVLVERMIAA